MEALDILKTQPIDLVLSDVKMPGMSGIDLLEKAKQIKPDLPCDHHDGIRQCGKGGGSYAQGRLHLYFKTF